MVAIHFIRGLNASLATEIHRILSENMSLQFIRKGGEAKKSCRNGYNGIDDYVTIMDQEKRARTYHGIDSSELSIYRSIVA